MNTFIQKSEEINSILSRWYTKHYANKLSFSSKRGIFTSEMMWEDMAIRLGNPEFEPLVYEFSFEERKQSISECGFGQQIFDEFYNAVINYKF